MELCCTFVWIFFKLFECIKKNTTTFFWSLVMNCDFLADVWHEKTIMKNYGRIYLKGSYSSKKEWEQDLNLNRLYVSDSFMFNCSIAFGISITKSVFLENIISIYTLEKYILKNETYKFQDNNFLNWYGLK